MAFKKSNFRDVYACFDLNYKWRLEKSSLSPAHYITMHITINITTPDKMTKNGEKGKEEYKHGDKNQE